MSSGVASILWPQLILSRRDQSEGMTRLLSSYVNTILFASKRAAKKIRRSCGRSTLYFGPPAAGSNPKVLKLLRSALSFGRIYDRENPRRTRSPSIKNYTGVFRVFELLAALRSNHPSDCLTRLRLTITFRPIRVKLTSIEIECTI